MTNPNYNSLVLFLYRTFTQKQWKIILDGCNCPKSSNFWNAFRKNCLTQYKRGTFTMEVLDEDIFNNVLNEYRSTANESVKKSNRKKKVRKQMEQYKTITLYQSADGSLTTERPTRD